MDQLELKRAVAEAALAHIEADSIIGIGTGSTVNCLIEAMVASKLRIEGAVSSSEATSERLRAIGVRVVDLNSTGDLDLYIDGADEFDGHRRLIKGGGGALTREKIVAAASRRFICIADESKRVGVLGAFALPVEVIPMARSLVARRLVGMGGMPVWREDFVTDNGNLILDVHHLDLVDPVRVEQAINNLAGVVSCGLFAMRPADSIIYAGQGGIKTI